MDDSSLYLWLPSPWRRGIHKTGGVVFSLNETVQSANCEVPPNVSMVTAAPFVSAFFVPGSHNHDGQQRVLPLSVLQTGSGAGPPRGLRSTEEPAGGEHH